MSVPVRLLLLSVLSFVSMGGCASPYEATDLDGTWLGRDHTINSRGKSLTDKSVKLVVDGNGLVRGTTSWHLVEGDGGDKVDVPVDADSEDIIGVFEPESGEFYLVEMRENGIWRGRMLSRNRLRAFLFQSGEKPVVSTIELERKID